MYLSIRLQTIELRGACRNGVTLYFKRREGPTVKNVSRFLPNLWEACTGRAFFQKKKQPIPVDLTHKDWVAQVRRATEATYMFHTGGSCLYIRRVAHLLQCFRCDVGVGMCQVSKRVETRQDSGFRIELCKGCR
jgi:hypothetical protein